MRAIALALVILAPVAAPGTAVGRPASVRVLVGTEVSPAAESSMSAGLWAQMIAAHVNADVVAFAGKPSADDCRKAKALYALSAPFEMRPRLPGVSNGSGRVAAQTRLVVINCLSGDVVYDQMIVLESDPPSKANAGDFESVPETTWSRVAPQTLAKFPLFFPRVARITLVESPLVNVDIPAEMVKVGDVLRVFATKAGEKRAPVVLTVTAIFPRYVQAIFSGTDASAAPHVGDYVEPAPKS